MNRPIKYKLDPNEFHEDAPFRTICQVLREAYSDLNQDFENIDYVLDRIREAYDLAKRMDRKLREYNKNYMEESGIFEPTAFQEPLDGEV